MSVVTPSLTPHCSFLLNNESDTMRWVVIYIAKLLNVSEPRFGMASNMFIVPCTCASALTKLLTATVIISVSEWIIDDISDSVYISQ